MNHPVTLRIVLESPPKGVDFGIQKGSGKQYTTIQIQRSDGQDLVFEFGLIVKMNQDSSLNFLGELTHGSRQDRFVYLDIGQSAGQIASIWNRRLKIPLKDISLEMLEHLSREPSQILETKVPGTGKDGGPNCATVKPFMGWYLTDV